MRHHRIVFLFLLCKKNETKGENNSSNVTKKPHPCAVCEASFDLKGELTLHLGTNHDHIRPHFCKLCIKGFQRSSDLKRHEGTQVHQEMVKKVAKGGLISEGVFILVPLPTKGAKSLP